MNHSRSPLAGNDVPFSGAYDMLVAHVPDDPFQRLSVLNSSANVSFAVPARFVGSIAIGIPCDRKLQRQNCNARGGMQLLRRQPIATSARVRQARASARRARSVHCRVTAARALVSPVRMSDAL